MTIVGFSLVCAVALYLISADMGSSSNPEGQTHMRMDVIETTLDNFYKDNGALPDTTENYRLVEVLDGNNPKHAVYFTPTGTEINQNKELVDGWKTPFRITFVSKDDVLIQSAGPDKIFGTPDDITNQPPK